MTSYENKQNFWKKKESRRKKRILKNEYEKKMKKL